MEDLLMELQQDLTQEEKGEGVQRREKRRKRGNHYVRGTYS